MIRDVVSPAAAQVARQFVDTHPDVNRLLLSKPYPAATTCVIVGNLSCAEDVDLAPFQRVLWCVEAGHEPVMPPAVRNRVTVVSPGASHPTFGEALDAFVLGTPNRLPSVFVTMDVARKNAVYAGVLEDLHAVLESYHAARVTRQKDAFQWQQHLLRNVAGYVNRRVPPAWQNALRGVPAFICGAGPSLDGTAPKIAPFADRAVVFSADSALRGLARHGLEADFAVSIDPAKLPEKCLAPGVPPPRVVLSMLSPPSWASAIAPDRRYFLTSHQLTADWLAAQGVAPTAVTAAHNCGRTALTLAAFLGCAPIYLVGMDLAVDAAEPARRHHSAVDGSVYKESGYDPARRMPLVPGNYQPHVPTFAYGDWRELNEWLDAQPAGLVRNVNDRGAQLRNTTLIHPADFQPPECRPDKPALLAQLPAPAAVPPAVTPLFARLHAAGRAINELVPQLEAALADGNLTAVQGALRGLFRNEELARILGAFSLKLMPHLVPPVNGAADFWRSMLGELQDLAGLMQQAG